MTDLTLADLLAAMKSAIARLQPGSGPGAVSIEEMENLKGSLDSLRLALWARLQAAHTEEPRTFEERFRLRRATELCSRLTADLQAGLFSPAHAELADLWIVVAELGEAIQAVRHQAGPPGG
jgi:hypothetical protein